MKLTRAEHISRAALIGRVYDCRDGTYCLTYRGTSDPTAEGMVDCETLQEINGLDGMGRWADLDREVEWDDYVRCPIRPWEREDD